MDFLGRGKQGLKVKREGREKKIFFEKEEKKNLADGTRFLMFVQLLPLFAYRIIFPSALSVWREEIDDKAYGGWVFLFSFPLSLSLSTTATMRERFKLT